MLITNSNSKPTIRAHKWKRIGTHFIPGLETPEGWFIHDTTPIGLMLNAKYPERSILPSSPVQRIAAHLLEDWADEWFGRYAISSRWCYPHNVEHVAKGFYANRIGKFMEEGLTDEEEAEAAEMIKMVRDNFGLNACANRGCGPEQADAVRQDFESLMRACDTHYSQHQFLLGNRASFGDFTLQDYSRLMSKPIQSQEADRFLRSSDDRSHEPSFWIANRQREITIRMINLPKL